MEIPKYKSNRRLSWDEICDEFPDVARQIVSEDQWRQFEQKPDFSDIPSEYQGMIPENIRNQKEDTRIYNIWLTKQ